MVLGRKRPPARAAEAFVADAEWLSASTVRIVLDGPEGFPGPAFADAYVKLVLLPPDVLDDVPAGPLDLEAWRERLPAQRQPRMRTYTVRGWDPGRGRLTLDFVVHGDAGIAGPWAARAKPGERIFVVGPGGGYVPDPAVGFHLFAGDASAAPAIAVALEALPRDARGHALIEVDGPDDAYPLEGPPGVTVEWLFTRGAAPGTALVPATRALPVDIARTQAFVHGEAGFVRDLRRDLKVGRGLPMERFSVSGYWRRGTDDEGWRRAKAEWQREVEADDTDPPTPR